MPVKMKVLVSMAGGHDPRVIKGSTVENGINWGPGDEIVVTDELAEKYAAAGLAELVKEVKPKVPEAAVMITPETASMPNPKGRTKA